MSGYYAVRSLNPIENEHNMRNVLNVMKKLYKNGLTYRYEPLIENYEEEMFLTQVEDALLFADPGANMLGVSQISYEPIFIVNRIMELLYRERVDLAVLVKVVINGTNNLKKFGYQVEADALYNFVVQILKCTCTFEDDCDE